MDEDLRRLLADELRDASAATADCPSMFERVSLGVHRRRRRRQLLGSVLVVVAIGAAAPVVVAAARTGAPAPVQLESAGCASGPSCQAAATERALLALRRANPPAPILAAGLRGDADQPAVCLHRPNCKLPV